MSLELLKRLEGEVLEALADLGGQEALRGLEGHTVDPHQFRGLEINPRAAAIAELVLWIGYLQWHLRTQNGFPSEPILKAFRNIEVRDAVLEADITLARDKTGKPVTRVGPDGAEMEVYRYDNPRQPEWPEAEFIVGNPPFIGGKDLRGRLGVEVARGVMGCASGHERVRGLRDVLVGSRRRVVNAPGTVLRRFGIVTTNSITQVFQRRVIERHLQAKYPVSIGHGDSRSSWNKVQPRTRPPCELR